LRYSVVTCLTHKAFHHNCHAQTKHHTSTLLHSATAHYSVNPSSDKFSPHVLTCVSCTCPDFSVAVPVDPPPLYPRFPTTGFPAPTRSQSCLSGFGSIVWNSPRNIPTPLQPDGDQAYMYVTGTQTKACKARQWPISQSCQNKVIHMKHAPHQCVECLHLARHLTAAMFVHLGTMGGGWQAPVRVLSRWRGHAGFILACRSDPLQVGQLAGLV